MKTQEPQAQELSSTFWDVGLVGFCVAAWDVLSLLYIRARHFLTTINYRIVVGL